MKKYTKLVSILLISLLLLTTKVYAANDSFETTIKASPTQVKQGETITITIGVDKIAIERGDKGIGAYKAKLVYNSSILEYDKSQGTEQWDAPIFQAGVIAGTTSSGKCVSTTQSIGTITFKVKQDAALGETTIQLTNFLGATGAVQDGDILASNEPTVKITVISSQSTTEPVDDGNNGEGSEQGNNNEDNSGDKSEQGNNNNNSQESNNGGQNSDGVQSNNNSELGNNNNSSSTQNKTQAKDTSTATGNIPQTGNENSFILASIVMLTGVAIVSAISYFKAVKKNSILKL